MAKPTRTKAEKPKQEKPSQKESDVKAQEASQPKGPEAQPRSEKSSNLLDDLYIGLAEQSYSASPYVPATQIRPYNPDDLYQKRNDYGIYEEMAQDDQISICQQIKKDLILGSGWDIVTEGDEELDTEVKEAIETALREDMGCEENPFEDALEEILSGDDFGFSLTEKVFKKTPEGMLTLKALRTRHPATWLIHTDDRGAVTKYEQLVEKTRVEINPKALIHYINKPKFQNPYGTSDLRNAYNPWFTKRQIIRWFGMFLEGAAGAKPVAKYDKSAPPAAVDAIYNAIKSFQAKTALAIPKDIEVEFLEAKSNGDAYVKAINLFNMFIGRALFIPDLLGFQGGETGGGSYSLGKDQIKVFFTHIKRRRERIERIVNQHLIKPMVLFNYGDMEKFPKFKLRPIDDEQATELAKLWIEAVKGKFYKPSDEEINHFRKLCRFPEGDVEREEQPQIDPATGLPMPPKGVAPGQPGKPGEKSKDADKLEQPPKGDEPPKKKELSAKVYSSTPGAYSKKVDFAAIESTMDRFKDKVVRESEPVLRRIYDDLGKQIAKKRVIETQNAEKLGTLSVKYLAEIKKIIKENLREAYDDAQSMGARELLKGEYARNPLPDEKFLEFIEAESGIYVDDLADRIKRQVRTRVVEAIKDGKPLSEILDTIDVDDFDDSEASIERFARTKFTEVMNRGRQAFFNESGVVAAYQYSAILDDRTSEICSGLHGKIFKAGSEPIPPMHFNCRSLLVPITKYEEFEVDTKVGNQAIDAFIADNKGEGFAKR